MARKSVDDILATGEADGHQLSKTLGPLSVTAIGLIRSPGPRGTDPGAHTDTAIPAFSPARASAKPVGPAS